MRRFTQILAVVVAMVIVGSSSASAASVDDFEVTRYDMKLSLDRDSENRSTLTTVETITAAFPEHDQNRGIERAIPKSYQDHPVGLSVQSVTDEQGRNLEFTTYDSSDNTVVRIGNKDTYVHGSKTYILTYTQRDVTRYFASTDKDEFYWDLNGNDWKVPIRNFTAEIHIADQLVGAFTQSSCYEGRFGSTDSCLLTKSDNTFTVSSPSLAAGENITVALGFAPGTFAPYEKSFWEKLLPYWIGAMIITGIGGLVAVIWAGIRAAYRKNRSSEIGSIAPEYTPPQDISVTAASEVIDVPRSVLAAQLIDLAVRHYIKIYETKAKSFWSSADYELEITKDPKTLRAEEREILDDLFDGEAKVGKRLEMKSLRNNTALYKRFTDNATKLTKLVRGEYGLRHHVAEESAWFFRLAKALTVIGVLTVAPLTLLYAVIVWLFGYSLWPLTDKGLAARRYLDGLKLYIGVAETDRLNMLQSPEGAEKVGAVSQDTPKKLVKLYEKVLPYAVLFGNEKEWGRQLGVYYENAGYSPEWYSGANMSAFNAAAMTSALSSFTTATSYTSASSSSSGGSSGGGSSGGGGGGGGGGGW